MGRSDNEGSNNESGWRRVLLLVAVFLAGAAVASAVILLPSWQDEPTAGTAAPESTPTTVTTDSPETSTTTAAAAATTGAPGEQAPVATAAARSFPDASSTGLSDPSLLTFHDGNLVITEDDTVVENLEINGRLEIRGAENVVVRNVWVYTTSAYSIRVYDGGSATIEDSEIGHPDHVSVGTRGVAGANVSGRRLDIHHVEDGIKLGDDSHYEEVYCHDLASASDEPHSDCAQDDGGGEGWSIRNSTLDAVGANAAVIITTSLNPTSDVVIDGNYLNGGNYTVYSRDGGNGDPTGVEVTNNAFGRDYRYGILSRDGDIVWEGNHWAETGRYIEVDGDEDEQDETAPTAQLRFSLSPDRQNAALLDGSTVSGDIFVFVEPEDGISGVTFYLNGAVSPFHVEENPPFDLMGTLEGASGFAEPLPVASLGPGDHTVRAVLATAGGSESTIRATFTVAGSAAD